MTRPERPQRTAITEFISERATVRLKDKLPCLDRSASSDNSRFLCNTIHKLTNHERAEYDMFLVLCYRRQLYYISLLLH